MSGLTARRMLELMVGFGVVVGAVVGGVSPSSIGKLEPAAGLGEWAESDGRIA